MKSKFYLLIVLLTILAISILPLGCSGSGTTEKIQSSKPGVLPGKYTGYTLLPNGWRLSPAGEQVPIGELPLNMVVTNDGQYAITSNSGMGRNSLSVINIKEKKEVQRFDLKETWYGLAFNSDDSELFVSGSNKNLIYIFGFNNGNLTLQDSILLGRPYPKQKISVTGLDYNKTKNILLAVSKDSDSLYVCNPVTKKVTGAVKMYGACYGVKSNLAGTLAYVSVWGKASIAVVNLESLKVINTIKVGDHPCQLILTKDGSRLFVANANNNTVSAVDLKLNKATETINSALSPDVPYGSTTNAICFNENDSVLYVANADNNYLALFDISEPNKTKSLGFIPVGWYPTAVKYIPGTNQILVANGKGLTSMPNPHGPHPTIRGYHDTQYIGSLFKGTLSIINNPDEQKMEEYTKQVYNNTPYVYKKKNWVGIQNIIPDKHDEKGSKIIKHVFYIIKENRTYDEVFGDIKEGNGDTSLCFFPYKVTPNQHRLAEAFTLYDNFYVDAEVSADGHNWSTAAYATDFVEKEWPANYGGRGQAYVFEGGFPLAAPSSGYIWNDAIDHNKTIRDYGEFAEAVKSKPGYYQARDEDLNKYTCHTYPSWDLYLSDVVRFEKWKADFDKLEKENAVPQLSIMRLPNDHTMGTRKGALTPQAYVAQNDYALGLIVQTISHSSIWKSSIIFVLEDDAQNGSDHVDAHRSTLLVISPYIKRHYVDHTMYSTSSVLKTIELILGLPPMTQYDLSATPILFSITEKPDFKPFESSSPLIDINKTNSANAYGSAECGKLNFTKADAIPDRLFNEILWKAIKGKNSVMPPPVRSAFVKVVKKTNKDED